MIKVNQVSRAYGDLMVVDSVSFEIPKGEIVGLLGHNGAGKTTIMKMLSGYLEPSAGQIEIDGIDLASEPQRIHSILGYLPESLPIYPDMSVADYLHYAATLKGLSDTGLYDSVRRAVRDTELQNKLLDTIATLSRGYKQRVGVAQAILGAPKVLILDEPSNGLDPSQTQHMRDLICAIAEKATVILSTHIMQEVDAICHRALILNNGTLALNENLSTLRTRQSLLLRADISEAELIKLTQPMTTITGLESIDGEHSFRLRLGEQTPPDEAAAMLASALTQADYALYQLGAEVRGLESVFREVNTQGSIAHAA